MPNYTSPSPANVALNGNQTTWWIPATNNSVVTATNVTVSVTPAPTNGLTLVTYQAEVGSYNPMSGVWSIGNLLPGAANRKWLKIVTAVADIGLAPFTLTSVISGDGIDPNAINNTLVQTVTSVVTSATAGAVADPNSCFCGDVSLNDTPCNFGTTEWRLNPATITNSTVYVWDDATGQYHFTPDDVTTDVTAQYSIWCDDVEISGPVTLTIPAIITDITPFNHYIAAVQYADLSVGDISVLTAQYPALVLADYCWNTLRNAEGVLTSGIPVQCDESVDTRTFFSCTEDACIADLGECACSAVLPTDVTAGLPVDYEPQDGDTVYIQHPESTSIWVYDAANTRWERNACGCVYKISQAAGNLLTLNPLDNAPYISDEIILDAVDEKSKVSANDTTSGFLNGKLVAGTGITLTETNDGANETLVITASAAPSTNVQVSDTPSINMGITGTGTVPDPFIISGAYNDGSPTPQYASGTPGSTGNTLNVTTLFSMACAGGFSATYTLNGYSEDVYDNVTLVGTTLTYDIKLTAPSGTHYINVQRTCA